MIACGRKRGCGSGHLPRCIIWVAQKIAQLPRHRPGGLGGNGDHRRPFGRQLCRDLVSGEADDMVAVCRNMAFDIGLQRFIIDQGIPDQIQFTIHNLRV